MNAFLQINNHRIHYQSQGNGPAVILLHNATGSTRDWRHLAPRLARAGYRAIAYDRPGFGRSDPMPHWPLDYLHHDRDDLLALMAALGLKRAALIGNSDGATISLLAAGARPQCVAAVVAESPHLWYEKDSLAQGFQRFEERLGQDPRFHKAMQRAHGSQAPQVIRRWRQRWLDPAFFGWDDRSVLAHITCPTLIIHGGQDHFFPRSHSQAIANALPGARFWFLPNAGHTPHLETPDDYAKTVISFLQEV